MTKTFECQSCKRTVSIDDDKNPPICCGHPMKQLPKDICLQPGNPESQRPMEDEEPCDDFRGESS